MIYEKRYIIPDDQLRQLIPPGKTCRISDAILVQGKPLRRFYRIMPEHFTDSGWRFIATTESDEYLARSELFGVYDLNIAANYCPEVIGFFEAPPYSAYEYDPESNKWFDVTLSTDFSVLT